MAPQKPTSRSVLLSGYVVAGAKCGISKAKCVRQRPAKSKLKYRDGMLNTCILARSELMEMYFLYRHLCFRKLTPQQCKTQFECLAPPSTPSRDTQQDLAVCHRLPPDQHRPSQLQAILAHRTDARRATSVPRHAFPKDLRPPDVRVAPSMPPSVR